MWSARDATVYWVDVDGQTIQALRWSDEDPRIWSVPGRPSCIALTAEPGRFIVGMGAGLIELQPTTGAWDELAALESNPSVRMNDGRPDPLGRLWIGSMDERDEHAVGFPGGHLFRIDHDGHVETFMEGVATSNGLAFSPDSQTMYWTDTYEQVVWKFDYDVASGSAVNRRVFFDCSGLPGKPDGACVDSEGCYWSACVYGWAIARITPDGRVDAIIELPVEKPSMPAFVGPGLDTLAVTSISSGGRRAASPGQPDAGALLLLDVGVSGLPEPLCSVAF